MATRTAVSQRYDDLQNAALERAGIDLVWTYTVCTEGICELCVPWLNRLLSLSGDTTGSASVTDAGGATVTHKVAGTLDEARAAGFWHVQCRCEYAPFVDGTDFDLLNYAGNSPTRGRAGVRGQPGAAGVRAESTRRRLPGCGRRHPRRQRPRPKRT